MKENDQHLAQLLPNKLVTPFITVLLVSINVFGNNHLDYVLVKTQFFLRSLIVKSQMN